LPAHRKGLTYIGKGKKTMLLLPKSVRTLGLAAFVISIKENGVNHF
jgi:hypothetical protein